MANKIGINSLQVTDHDKGGTTAWNVGGTCDFTPSGEVGEIVPAANKAHAATKVTQMPGSMEIEGVDGGKVTVQSIMQMRNCTVIASLANGNTQSCKGTVTGQPTISNIDGTLTFKVEGVTQEIIAP